MNETHLKVKRIFESTINNITKFDVTDENIYIKIDESEFDKFIHDDGRFKPLIEEFKCVGFDIDVDYELYESTDGTHFMSFNYKLYEDKDDSDDPTWEIVFKDGSKEMSKGNNSQEAIANAVSSSKNKSGIKSVKMIEESEMSEGIDPDISLLKNLFNV